jgi:hypothetical protein
VRQLRKIDITGQQLSKSRNMTVCCDRYGGGDMVVGRYGGGVIVCIMCCGPLPSILAGGGDMVVLCAVGRYGGVDII